MRKKSCKGIIFLTKTYFSLLRADELEINSIAFPSLTSGVFGFPRDRCAEIIINKCLE